MRPNSEVKQWVRRMQVMYRKHMGPTVPVLFEDVLAARTIGRSAAGVPLSRELTRDAEYHTLACAARLEDEHLIGNNRKGRRN